LRCSTCAAWRPRADYKDRVTGATIPAVTTAQIYKGSIAFIVLQVIMVAAHLGPLPAERLPRQAGAPEWPARQPGDSTAATTQAVAAVVPDYLALCAGHLAGAVAAAQAPVPDDLQARADNLKATAIFLDATLAGVCALRSGDLADGACAGHTHALVFLVEFSREAHADEPGAAWTAGSNAARTDLRCAEVAAVVAGYIRTLGWAAQGHVQGHVQGHDLDPPQVDLCLLAQRAGVAVAVNGVLAMPFTGNGFRVGVVTTSYAMATDLPIAPGTPLCWPDSDAYMGVGGTRPGFDAAEQAHRPLHQGRHPMERIPRVDEPTTLVLRDEIQRVPKRADLFTRALAGDLGDKPRQQRSRFAVKHPLAWAMTPLIRGLVPLQGTREPLPPTHIGPPLQDAAHNTLAVKALAHFLGAELVGICAAEPWMYYSHDETEGRPIDAYHPFAIVLLIDQGFETMEGASGDDWISGAQSMRAYLRGALLAGVLAAHLRRLGHSSRVHSNAHSELLHIPAVLMAGLGELSRIGELILNPFIGPRSKSVVITTSLPLVPDKPCMKLSKPASVKRNHRFWSRGSWRSRRRPSSSSGSCSHSLYSAMDSLKAASITSFGNGNSLAPPATRRLSAAGLRASYLACMSVWHGQPRTR
jgi:hypothetical protein